MYFFGRKKAHSMQVAWCPKFMVEMLFGVKSCCPGMGLSDTLDSKLNQYFTRLTSPLTSPCCLNFHYWDWWTLQFISWNTKHTQKCNNSNWKETSTKSTKRRRLDVGFPLYLPPFPLSKKNGSIDESWRQSFVRK